MQITLKAARELLSKPGAWTQGVMARDASRQRGVAPLDSAAACWCLEGAVGKASFDTRFEPGRTATPTQVLKVIETELGQKASRWNDDPARTQEEVLALLDRLIAKGVRYL